MSTLVRRGLLESGRLAGVALLVAVPFLILMWLEPEARSLDRAALAHELLVYPSVLAAGMLLYVCWRVSQNPPTAWLAAGITLVGVQGLGLAAVSIARPGTVEDHGGWLAIIDLAVQLLLITTIAVAPHRAPRADPFLAGLIGGVLITVGRIGSLSLPSMGLDETSLRGLAAGVFVGQVLTAALVARLPRLPRWLRGRIGAAVVLLAASHLIVTPRPVDAVGNRIAIVLGIIGTAVLLDTAFVKLKTLLHRQGRTMRGLHEQVQHLEADVRIDRARLHEVSATLAGIANASWLLHTDTDLSPAHRKSLERSVDAEAARLLRLMDQRHVAGPEECDLDAVLEPIVTAHRVRGRVVHWEPSGLKAFCCPDDIAEVVNILLENAAQHAGTATELSARPRGSSVCIEVTDHGPGIPPDVLQTLFVWGKRGPVSPGQGIGLHIALRLMTEQGGDLEVVSDTGVGTTFVATIAEAADDWRNCGDGSQLDS